VKENEPEDNKVNESRPEESKVDESGSKDNKVSESRPEESKVDESGSKEILKTYRFNIHLDSSDCWINMSLKDCDNLPEFNVAYDKL
jgi:hypothetical protein